MMNYLTTNPLSKIKAVDPQFCGLQSFPKKSVSSCRQSFHDSFHDQIYRIASTLKHFSFNT